MLFFCFANDNLFKYLKMYILEIQINSVEPISANQTSIAETTGIGNYEQSTLKAKDLIYMADVRNDKSDTFILTKNFGLQDNVNLLQVNGNDVSLLIIILLCFLSVIIYKVFYLHVLGKFYTYLFIFFFTF